MNKYRCGLSVNIGYERESQEDFVQFQELDEKNLLCLIADGTGSREEYPKPAAIVVMDIIDHIKRIVNEEKTLFFQNPEYFLKDAFRCANQTLGALKLGNEELFSGYAASVTAALFTEYNKVHFCHCGNTRAYIMRDGRLTQITKDHTKGAELYEQGTIDYETYHVHPDRLKMTSGIGVLLNPVIQTATGVLRPNDLVILTTDGVHYAIRQEFIMNLVLEGHNCEEAAANLVNASLNGVKYPDNMAAMVIHGNPDIEA